MPYRLNPHSQKASPNNSENPIHINPQQKQASEAPAGPLLIVAGAGTGKTTTLTERLIHLIRSGVPPKKICALTFTNKAAHEMLSRVQKKAGALIKPGREPFIGTFHSFGARILRKEAHALGRDAGFAIFDDHDSFDLIKKIFKQRAAEKSLALKRAEDKKTKEKPAVFAAKISELKNTNRTLDLKTAREKADFLTLKILSTYEEKLRANNAFDFDDLIDKVVHLFHANPAVLSKYQNLFEAFLVDEYQDLNPRQYEFVKLLAGDRRNLSVVGDDEQLIYGWRYANLEIFLNFEADWPNARVTFLEENYRSTGNIIAAAAAVSKNNKQRRPKNLWTQNPEGEKITVTEVHEENEEGELIANQIEMLKSRSPENSIAVLYRTNAQSRALEQALLRHRIPYKIFGGLKFYERKEIKDVVAGIRYIVNPKDEISKDRLEKSLTKRVFREIAATQWNRDAAPRELIEKFIEATEYLGYLERNFINFAERQENLLELMHFASQFSTPSDFLQDIALIQATDNPNVKRGTDPEVHLMTIHLAKGLEFDAVFIAGCAEGILPHARSIEDENRLEEERRLMYVAMTRARSELFISFYDVPSRFLGEIPAELTNFYVLEEKNLGWDEDSYVTLD